MNPPTASDWELFILLAPTLALVVFIAVEKLRENRRNKRRRKINGVEFMKFIDKCREQDNNIRNG